MLKVSVIVPVYNVVEYVEKSVESLLNMTGVDFELILVDDGSTDGSVEVCLKLAEKNPQSIRFIPLEHGGVSVARNTGLEAARGEWIYFCDPDDYVEQDLLSYLLAQAETNGADISCGAIIVEPRKAIPEIRTNFKLKCDQEFWSRDEVIHRAIRPFFRLHGEDTSARGYLPVMLIRRALLEEHRIRFTPGQFVMEDEAFLLRCLVYVQKMALSKKVLYHYVPRNNSACASFFRKKRFSYYDQERMWFMISENRVAVYESGELATVFPEIADELYLGRMFHQAAVICSQPKTTWSNKFATLAQARKETLAQLKRYQHASCRPLSRKQAVFYGWLRMGTWSTLLFCRMLQWGRTLQK